MDVLTSFCFCCQSWIFVTQSVGISKSNITFKFMITDKHFNFLACKGYGGIGGGHNSFSQATGLPRSAETWCGANT